MEPESVYGTRVSKVAEAVAQNQIKAGELGETGCVGLPSVREGA